jgi:hypothetical protein
MHLTINQVQTERKRLDGCVLMLPKWTKTQERLEICTCGPLKIDNRAADTTITVESAQENDRPCHNAKLLGKYRVSWVVTWGMSLESIPDEMGYFTMRQLLDFDVALVS